MSDVVAIIDENQYNVELEKEVKRYMNQTVDLPFRDKAFSRTVLENFKNPTEQHMWEVQEIERCLNGHADITGKMYFYVNYCKILDIKRGNILPDFRVADDAWFNELQICKDSNGEGLVCVKRRRVGASWKEASDVLHDTMFNPFYNVGMNSKSELDSVELFKKVRHIYSHLPGFLRATSTAGNTKMSMDFSYYTKDEMGNRIKRGTQSVITVKAPTAVAFEGLMLQKWVCDEAGKIKDLLNMFSMTEPCLMAGPLREGIPVVFGTSGEIGREGTGLKYIWDKAPEYRMRRFFYSGYNGLILDDKGNDQREHAIRWIVYERFRRRNLNPKQYNDFIQQYPLTVREAFSQSLTGGLGDIVKVNSQLSSLQENPFACTVGRMKVNPETLEVKHVPDSYGKVKIYEPPKEGETYVVGCDPADHDDVTDEASDLSLYVIKEPNGTNPPQIVASYTDRPANVNDYFEQALAILMYYHDSKVLIEKNRFAMLKFFKENGYTKYIQPAPQGLQRLVHGRAANNWGVTMTTYLKEYMEDIIEEYIHEYCDIIPEEELLEEFKEYGAVNTDKVMAFGIALIYLKERSIIKGRKLQSEVASFLPDFGFKRVNGKTVRYTKTQRTPLDPLGLINRRN
jgi:hypothetical protein